TVTALAEHGPLSTAALENHVELSRGRLENMLKVLDVDQAVRRVRGGWEATGREWVYDADRYARVAEARERERQAMLDYIDTDDCRMWFLRDQLDDPAAQRCGRCDNCGGLELLADVSESARADAAAALERPGVTIAPRKQWLTGLASLGLDLKGRIRGSAGEGRAIARLTDLGHGQRLRELFRDGGEGAADGPVPEPLVRAIIDVLVDWQPQVEVIAYVESATRPTLTRDLADGLSRYLRLPVIGRFYIVYPSILTGAGHANTTWRIIDVY